MASIAYCIVLLEKWLWWQIKMEKLSYCHFIVIMRKGSNCKDYFVGLFRVARRRFKCMIAWCKVSFWHCDCILYLCFGFWTCILIKRPQEDRIIDNFYCCVKLFFAHNELLLFPFTQSTSEQNFDCFPSTCSTSESLLIFRRTNHNIFLSWLPPKFRSNVLWPQML